MVEFSFLGTANAFGHAGMLQSCYLIEGTSTILLDAGPGLLTAIHGISKSILDLDLILISHLHPDHYLGLLLMGLEDCYVTKRPSKINVYGPIGIANTIEKVSRVLYNTDETDHIMNLYKFNEHGINEKIEHGNIVIQTLFADHSANARSIIVHIDGKSIGYSGDSGFVPDTFDKLLACDLTITEATSYGFDIPNHTSIQELQYYDIPSDKVVYISHMDESVRKNLSKIDLPLFPAYDGLKVSI